MYDLLTIGNITIDFYFQGASLTHSKDRFELAIGGKYMAEAFHMSVGGGGANVAIGVARHKKDAAVAGLVGNNSFKEIIFQKLHDAHVPTTFVGTLEKFTSVSTILLNDKGEKTIVHYSTPEHHLMYRKFKLENLQKTKALFLGNMQEIPIEERIHILRTAKKFGVTTFVNIGVHDCRRPLNEVKMILEPADVVILNGHEFADMVRAPYKDIHFKDDVVNWYAHHLHNKTVIITDGENGSYGYTPSHAYFQSALAPRKIIDTTGAGDGYTAGFISSYIVDRDVKKAMETGAKYAEKIMGILGANEA